jgi:adenylate cyclase
MGGSWDVLNDLIEQRLQVGADIKAIDEKIWSMFGETWAVLCSDMSGFTRRTEEFGIIHFLSLIHDMQKLLKPIIAQYNGLLIKMEADNLFIIFRQPEQAIRCSMAMHQATRNYNENKTADYRIQICIGIGYGELLKIGDEDCFGSEVNRSFKLGEDIACAGETLLTPSAYEKALSECSDLKFEKVSLTKDGPVKEYFRIGEHQ